MISQFLEFLLHYWHSLNFNFQVFFYTCYLKEVSFKFYFHNIIIDIMKKTEELDIAEITCTKYDSAIMIY